MTAAGAKAPSRKCWSGRTRKIVGRFVQESGVALVVPDDPRINQDVMIPLGDTLGARPGQIVVAQSSNRPLSASLPVGKIVEILGECGAPGMATEIAIRNFGLPHIGRRASRKPRHHWAQWLRKK